MKIQLYTPVFSLTLLLSAALLFSVQPMFSKMILPLLGGTPQVWNTAMLFFQVMLLGGYAYAHGTTRFLSVRVQAIVHLVLLTVFLFVLPIAIPAGWEPPPDKDPTLWQLSVMLMTVGGPFFVLAGSAPMLQRWFTTIDHPDASDPYFLYGASNVGSMTALLSYPIVIEPLLKLNSQSNFWMGGYVLLMICTLAAAALAWKQTKKKDAKTRKAANDSTISWSLRAKWIILAFIPSSLMLGVTTFITTDIASVPLLWIIPLALYVGTFIIAFSRKPIIPKEKVILAQGVLMIVLIVQMIMFRPEPVYLIAFHMILFFVSALACHMELTASRPRAEHLTEFYLIMSLGGALGGILNAIIAPNFFVIPLEYALALAAACFMRYASEKQPFPKEFDTNAIVALTAFIVVIFTFNIYTEEHMTLQGILALIIVTCLSFIIDKRWLFAIAISASLVFYPPGHLWGKFIFDDVIHQDRNFFGVMKVIDTKFDQRILLHGTTNHGTQAKLEKYKLTPLSYYSPASPLRDAFDYMDERSSPQKIGAVGLGIGVVACFQKKGRHFDFFEIDGDIARIAENVEYFTFLADCGSPYDIILGDGRLTIQKKPDKYYDMILIDVFSSDNIPVHVLTKEAIQIYLDKLKDDGILVFNISNNYLDIEPVIAQAGKSLGLPAYARLSKGGRLDDTDLEYYIAHFAAISKTKDFTKFLEDHKWTPARERIGVGLWTDQYSNIIGVLQNMKGYDRMVELVKADKEKEEKENSGE